MPALLWPIDVRAFANQADRAYWTSVQWEVVIYSCNFTSTAHRNNKKRLCEFLPAHRGYDPHKVNGDDNAKSNDETQA
jgi:hypothetical protein